MIDSQRFKLIYGPYVAPRCRVGDKLTCEYRGREVTVRGISNGLIQWPGTRRTGNASPILCGDLIRAVQTESSQGVAFHWGVKHGLVWRWRRALNVAPMTNGSRRLRIEYAVETLTPEVRAKAREAMHSTEVREKLSALRKGQRPHPNMLAAALEAVKRPKSEKWKQGQSERSRKMWENPEAYGLPPRRHWTDEEIALLGTDTDRAIAARLGVPLNAVKNKRARLDIPGLCQPWTADDLALLGTAPDAQLARTLGKSSSAIRRKREALGVSTFAENPWTELALLGTDTDRNIARLLGRTEEAVRVRRKKARIPVYR
jgi:hypothetical protein